MIVRAEEILKGLLCRDLFCLIIQRNLLKSISHFIILSIHYHLGKKDNVLGIF